MVNLIDTLNGAEVNRGLLEDAFETIQEALNVLDGDGTRPPDVQEYHSLTQAAQLLRLALDLP